MDRGGEAELQEQALDVAGQPRRGCRVEDGSCAGVDAPVALEELADEDRHRLTLPPIDQLGHSLVEGGLPLNSAPLEQELHRLRHVAAILTRRADRRGATGATMLDARHR